jgi:hypothetical protein
MSSIAEVKAQIAAAVESANEAMSAITSATSSIDHATARMVAAAEGSGHPKIEEAVKCFMEAKTRLEEAGGLVLQGIRTAEEYVAAI